MLNNIFQFDADEYKSHRNGIIQRYSDYMVLYLSKQHPTLSIETITSIVEEIIRKKLRDPIVTYDFHPVPGKTIEKKTLLSRYSREIIDNNVFSISGTIYKPENVHASFLSTTLKNQQDKRAVFKKLMQKAIMEKDTVGTMQNYVNQTGTKRNMNSCIGATGSVYAFLYDNPGFNAVTSISRHCVKYGYSHIERLLTGNLFLVTLDDAIHYAISLINILPTNINTIINKYKLYIPTVEELVDYINTSLSMYTDINYKTKLLEKFSSFTDEERVFVFYTYNLKNLFSYNSTFFRSFIKDLFISNNEIIKDLSLIDPDTKLDKDLSTMIHAAYSDIKDESTKLYLQHRANIKIDLVSDILQCFLRVDIDVPNINGVQNMVRKCVPVSDTDSAIFTTASIVEWYCGHISFGKEAMQVNMLTVYLISRTLAHVFAKQSTELGSIGDSRFLVTMKNEFYYLVLIMAQIKKHYAAIQLIQEGNILPEPVDDIKGLGFKSSNLSAYSIEKSMSLLHECMTKIVENNYLDVNWLLTEISDFEYEIYFDLQENKTSNFYGIQSIKPMSQYSDPDGSIYRYYQLWEDVFSVKYGHINIPSKCYVVPVEQDGVLFQSEGYMEWLKTVDASLSKRLSAYFHKTNYKEITRFSFPMSMKLPDEMKSVISIRNIISNNCAPLYLLLRCLGITYEYKKKTGGVKVLVSDYYRSEKNINLDIPITNV